MSRIVVITPNMTTAADRTFLVANRAARGAIKIAPDSQHRGRVHRWTDSDKEKKLTDTLHGLIETRGGTEFGERISSIESISGECSDGS